MIIFSIQRILYTLDIVLETLDFVAVLFESNLCLVVHLLESIKLNVNADNGLNIHNSLCNFFKARAQEFSNRIVLAYLHSSDRIFEIKHLYHTVRLAFMSYHRHEYKVLY